MSFVLGLLLVIVSLAGAFMVAVLVGKLWREQPDDAWENMIAVLVGVGLLVWPVARQASLDHSEQQLDEYRRILELDEAGRYRLVNERTGETLAIVVDEKGQVQLRRSAPPAPDGAPSPSEEQTPPQTPPGEEETIPPGAAEPEQPVGEQEPPPSPN